MYISGPYNKGVNSRTTLLVIASIILILVSLPLWFITLMALIAGRAWSLATGLAGLALIAGAAVSGYWAYSIVQEGKMKDARDHNMEREVVAVAKKKNGMITAADLVGVGFGAAEAEAMLDAMGNKGLCSINLDATKYSGVKTYVFPQEVRIRCKYCSTPLDISWTHCPSCGAPVEMTNVRPQDLPGANTR